MQITYTNCVYYALIKYPTLELLLILKQKNTEYEIENKCLTSDLKVNKSPLCVREQSDKCVPIVLKWK